MKNNWQIKKLNEICDKASSNISQNQLSNEVGNYPIYGASGFIKNISFYHQEKDYISIVKDGAGIGRIALLPAKSSVIGTLQYLIPREEVDIKFLYYILNSFDFLKYKNGATIPHIYFREYSEEKFLIPPLPEQRRIVKILDETFEKIEKAKENAEKNLKNSKELFESYLNNIFASSCNDWCEKKISDVCDVGAGNSAPQKKELFVGGKYPFFRTSDVGRIHIGIISDSSDYLNDKGIKGLRLFNKGTILLPKSGASTFLNHRVVLGIDGYVSSHLATIKTDKNILNNNYLFYFLQRIKAQDLIQDHRYPSLNLPVIGGIKISYPSLSEQKSIVTRLDKLSVETKKLESIYKQKLADLEELKKSILKKAFNGEL